MRNELRQNPYTKDWVIIAKGRSKRIKDIAKPGEKPKLPRGYRCPLCYGQEPNNIETFRLGGGKPNEPGWEVRSILNKAPYFEASSEEETGVLVGREIFRSMAPIGSAEVLAETHDHFKDLVFLNEEELEKVLLAYQFRYLALRKAWTEINIFRNHGYLAGQSLAHPHTQIAATKEKSPQSKKEELNSIEYYYEHNECIYCDTIEAEKLKKKRVVFEDKDFLAICPWASQSPFEIMILPKRHCCNFGDTTLQEIRDLSKILQEILRKMYIQFGDPAYNFYIRSFPKDPTLINTSHWYLQILFHLSIQGGYEFSTDSFVNAVPPENAAEMLKKIKTSKFDWRKEYKIISK